MMSPAAVKKERASTTAGAAQQPTKKGPWTALEDAILKKYVRIHGAGNWNALQKNSCLQRGGKSCRLRWMNHCRPNLNKDSFSPEEEMIIARLHAEVGNKWAYMAKQLPGRTDNDIKNYWNTRIRRTERERSDWEGSPLYPPEIQKHISLTSHGKGQNASWTANSPPVLKPSQTAPSSFISSRSPLSENQCGYILQNPNRGKYISFQLPYDTSPAQNGLKNFDLGPTPYSVNKELPSSQFSPEFGGEQMPQGNIVSLNDLLQESDREATFLAFDFLGKLGYFDYPFGIDEIEEFLGTDELAVIDMILREMTAPTPTITFLPDCCNHGNNGEEFWNPPSLVTTGEDIWVDMHQLEWMPPISPVEFY